jgi:hypothetical protein
MVGNFNGFFCSYVFFFIFWPSTYFCFYWLCGFVVLGATILINTCRICTMQWIISGELICNQLLHYEEAFVGKVVTYKKTKVRFFVLCFWLKKKSWLCFSFWHVIGKYVCWCSKFQFMINRPWISLIIQINKRYLLGFFFNFIFSSF